MQPLITAELMAGSMCLVIGLLHLALFLKRPEFKAELLFGLLCLFAAGSAFSEMAVYQATAVDEYARAFKLQLTLQVLQWIALAWFIFLYTGATRRWVAIAVSVAYAVAVFINMVSPYGVLFSGIDNLSRVTLAWGERITFANGPTSNWRYVADAGWVLLLFLSADSCVRLARRGDRRRAFLLGLSPFVFLGLAYLHGTFIDLGIVGPPPLHNFAFLGLVIVMSSSLTGEVVRASQLSREVASNERRWRTLLKNVRLLVAGLNSKGIIDYVNPYFLEVTGYQADELLGKSIIEVVPQAEREDLETRLERAWEGHIRQHTERALLRKDGAIRHIRWSHALIPDSAGKTSINRVQAAAIRMGADRY